MIKKNKLRLALTAVAGCLVISISFGNNSSIQAQTPQHDHSITHPLKTKKHLATSEVTSIRVPDITMIDQDNRSVRLYDGVMKNKLVVLNYFYTKCEGVCSTAGHWLSKLQDKIGPRLGKEIVIVSISIDPEVDTPKRINQWGTYWKRKKGWTLLTSRDKAVRDLMSKFTPYPSMGLHSPIVFVGDATKNPVEWMAVDLLDEGWALLDYFKK